MSCGWAPGTGVSGQFIKKGEFNVKTINQISTASLKGVTLASSQHVNAAAALTMQADPGAIELSGTEAFIASLLPNLADILPQDAESSTAGYGKGGDSAEEYKDIRTGTGTDTTDSDDDGSGFG